MQPSPENYRIVFQEVSGLTEIPAFPERELKALQAALPRKTAEQVQFAQQMATAITAKDWGQLNAALVEFFTPPGKEENAWPELIRDLVRQLSTTHAEITTVRKKDALEHVLAASGTPNLLFTRLQSLVRTWAKNTQASSLAMVEISPVSGSAEPAGSNLVTDNGNKNTAESFPGKVDTLGLQKLIAQLLDNTLNIVLADQPELAQEAHEISVAVSHTENMEVLNGLADQLKKLSYRVHFVVEDRAEVGTALIRLTQLILENISELVIEDQWLTGQINLMRELMAQPLDLRRLDEVDRRMKDVIAKQGLLKKSLVEANDRLKLMLATFVDHLANFSETTKEYHGKIEICAEKISQAKDVVELTEVLDVVMRETREVQVNTARSRDDLQLMRSRVRETEQEVARLQDELTSTSALVLHDHLTGVFNRRGLDEALKKEVARQQRQGGTLSLALLDIDNFKKINDTQGHVVGDAALKHLARVVMATIRPHDILARFGGEEFVILLPNTRIEDAIKAMARVQRELTREFFMAGNEKILITFSCGVVEVMKDEDPYVAISRADAAMYAAKRSGKNRVVPA